MKNVLLLVIFILLFFQNIKALESTQPKKVVLTGKVLNFDKNLKQIRVIVYRPGFSELTLYSNLDNHGFFHFSFDSYNPTDVFLDYKVNTLLLVHPGDSLFIEFDGNQKTRTGILKSIKFSGDRAKSNWDASNFLRKYYSSKIYLDKKSESLAIKQLDWKEYIEYLNVRQQKYNTLFHKFVKTDRPNEDVKDWAKTYISDKFYSSLKLYPELHKKTNKFNNIQWDVPLEYYNQFCIDLPISKSMLISGYALSSFINEYYYSFVRQNLINDSSNKTYLLGDGKTFRAQSRILDSLFVYGIVKYTQDDLLRQMVLTNKLSQDFVKGNLAIFNNHRKLIDSIIQEPFLKEPLMKLYQQTEARIENPHISSKIIMSDSISSPIKSLMDSIILSHKGKVVYVDCWATWCAPCRVEMPNSKILIEKMVGKDVAFVFICIDSEEKLWKSSLDEFSLDGYHLYLNKEQSADFRNRYGINGVPHYFLFDKKGSIVNNSNIRPANAGYMIEELLKK